MTKWYETAPVINTDRYFGMALASMDWESLKEGSSTHTLLAKLDLSKSQALLDFYLSLGFRILRTDYGDRGCRADTYMYRESAGNLPFVVEGYTLGSETGLVSLYRYSKDELQTYALFQDEATFCKVVECVTSLQTKKDKGSLSLLTMGKFGGFEFTPIGVANTPLIRSNYTTSQLDDFDHIVQDMQEKSPCGRLVILEGEAGTGKTYYTRGLIEALPFEQYYYLPPHMVSKIASPEMLGAWLKLEKRPIVLVIEDADGCLVPRAADNMGDIQALLNLTDGFIGSMLDIRVICTTNARKLDLDPALLRKGRLCRHVKIGALKAEHGRQIYRGLLPGVEVPTVLSGDRGVTLGDVYGLARDAGWRPE